MKKELIISVLALSLIVTPALAKQGNSNENIKNNENKENHKKDKDEDRFTPTITASISPSISNKPSKEDEEEELDERQASPSASPTCNPKEEYKNHGKYVSCVARRRPGGEEVSEAARSDIGKKNKNNPSPTITPLVSPTISSTTSALPSIQRGSKPDKFLEKIWVWFTKFFASYTNLKS